MFCTPARCIYLRHCYRTIFGTLPHQLSQKVDAEFSLGNSVYLLVRLHVRGDSISPVNRLACIENLQTLAATTRRTYKMKTNIDCSSHSTAIFLLIVL